MEKRPLGVYLTILWGVILIAYMCVLFITATAISFNPYNVIALLLIVISIVGLWLMKKWGAAITIVFSSMFIAESMYYLQVAYYSPEMIPQIMGMWLFVALYTVSLVISILIVVYLFRSIFKRIFR